MSAPVMIMAGGTGGHVFPGLAVARELARRDVPIVWLGTRAGLEAEQVPAAGIPLEHVSVRGLRGNGLRGWLLAPWMLLRAVGQARRAIRRHRPRAVLGMGGYAAGPGAIAAWLSGVPLVIHEQNAVPGLTNRWLVRLARRVLTGFDGVLAGPKARFVGNPVREALIAARQADATAPNAPPHLLVLGGSLGAEALNQIVPAALALMAPEDRPQVRHQAGKRTLGIAREAYGVAGVEAEVSAFIDDMAAAYRWADLVICRAGALTVAELAVMGVPALLVPLPHAVDDHQRANARYLADAGAGELLSQRELTAQLLCERLEHYLHDDNTRHLAEMAERARALGRPDAAAAVADACLEVAR
ncbi:undecaprenyldiphospho-muramoylpentapeptide beta-N-acetylglucosaminyltransferase [Alkalilimnicola sp. S0819]|uniref:undecaprenyldiphospho-muramoylpentapeptide beta-N-acetylglucosaminyltransferase n=1 Tax=Alkalilimnicola sp. S0819 TaxID=2613922 RepID=UPI001261819A|nr:undecaprenyldiphospho-muramoylpentapeptide beta-N-acetylglucosaminyltransferase [Alkalilimnicola sp. S0819]KAB7623856.1 undecaprenyldiphospho-muramoylpentapeptide beta-N-acetylglucosaminyltransferase [Alkalilimnicola sp. S0819]MPQ16733.1 undecaprenyldiphospho-muramoylpentapeptide beta-N-acetylglucosaminyltransferase [Alkalilimnicola sp. S0819]